jgi:hypothetical protein
VKRVVQKIVSLPMWVKLTVVGISLVAITTVSIFAISDASSPMASLVNGSSTTSGNSLTSDGTPSPGASADRDRPSANQTDSSQATQGQVPVCDTDRNHGNIPDECTAGYSAPRVQLESIVCEPTLTDGTFTIAVNWKTVGGNFTRATIRSRNADGPLTEKWLLAGVTAETVIVDNHRVWVKMASMNGQPGEIDNIKSASTGVVSAQDVCPLG